MKIGIVSVQDAANCGAYLQGYALEKTLCALGHEAGFVNRINANPYDNQFYLLKTRQIFTHPMRYFQKLKPGLKKYRAYARGWQQYRYFNVQDVDALVLGSDEIWNLDKSRYLNRIYFGTPDKPCIAYAPSGAGCPPALYAAIPHVKPAIERMHRIMVRDIATQKSIFQATGRRPEVVCDPTVLVDFENHLSPDTQKLLENPYLLIYGYQHTPEEVAMTRAFAARNHLKIVSANFNVAWADVVLFCSPLEFPGIVFLSQCVVTSSFHCAIFALKARRPLAVFPSGNKVTDLLDRYQANACIASDAGFEDFCQLLTHCPLDFDAVQSAMMEDRTQSLKKLKEALDTLPSKSPQGC